MKHVPNVRMWRKFHMGHDHNYARVAQLQHAQRAAQMNSSQPSYVNTPTDAPRQRIVVSTPGAFNAPRLVKVAHA